MTNIENVTNEFVLNTELQITQGIMMILHQSLCTIILVFTFAWNWILFIDNPETT